MAILWLDGFDATGNGIGDPPTPSDILDRRYTASSDQFLDTIEGRGAYQYGFVNGNTSWNMYTPNLTTNAILIAGIAYRPTLVYHDQNGYDQIVMRFRTGTTTGLTLRNVGGTLRLFGPAANLLGEVKREVMRAGRWNYIEMKAFCNDTTGTVDVCVNGALVISVNSVDTKPGASAYLDNVYLGGQAMAFDDFYVADGTGSTNNDFLGPIKVRTRRPTSDSTNNFDSGTYADVDEEEIDDGTSYAESQNAAQQLVMNYEALTDLTSIEAVGVYAVAASSVNATAENYKVVVETGNQVLSANLTVNTTTNTTFSSIGTVYYDTDPDTSNSWNQSTFNSAKFGVELQ